MTEFDIVAARQLALHFRRRDGPAWIVGLARGPIDPEEMRPLGLLDVSGTLGG